MGLKENITSIAFAIGLGIAPKAVAEGPWDNASYIKRVQTENMRQARDLANIRVKVDSCPDSKEFWWHWNTDRGYEHLVNGNLKEAAQCYTLAGERYREGVGEEFTNDCLVCDSYQRIGTILRNLPSGAINLQRETFEESATRALESGKRTVAVQLYELAGLGWYLEIEEGRFRNLPVHREQESLWQDHYLKGGELLEIAARYTTDESQRHRLLQSARDVTAVLANRGHYGEAIERVKYLDARLK